MKKPIIVAMDGPAGAGKSTVAKTLAKKLGFLHIAYGRHVPFSHFGRVTA